MRGQNRNYVVCLHADDESDIQVRKIYEVLPDETAEKRGYLCIVDESGEDYIYPRDCFCPIELPDRAIHTLTSVSTRRANGSVRTTQKTRRD
jgi:hypothetical protein